MDKYKIQELHPELYKEICELVPALTNKTLDSLKEHKGSSFGEKKPFANLQNFMSVKAKIGSRSSYRSKSPIGYYSKNSPREDQDTANNVSTKSIKKSEVSYNSSKSRSRLKVTGSGIEKSSEEKSVNLGPKNSAPNLSEIKHTKTECDHSSNSIVLGAEGVSKPGYSNFLKKISNLKSGNKASGVDDKEKDKENKPYHFRAQSQFDSNKENDPRAANLPSIASKTPTQLQISKSQKSLLTVERDSRASIIQEKPTPVARTLDQPPELKVEPKESKHQFFINQPAPSNEGIFKSNIQEQVVQDEPLSSKNIFQDIPYVQTKDTMGYKIEALKYYLEKKMGLETLLAVYQSLVDSSDDSDHRMSELPIMTPAQEAYVPFVHHLVFCELNYFEN